MDRTIFMKSDYKRVYLTTIKYMRFYFNFNTCGLNNFEIPIIRDESNPIIHYGKYKNI